MSSHPRELSELGGIISSDVANNQLVIATGIRFPDDTVQTTAGVAVDQYARDTANLASSVNSTQNNSIITVTGLAQAAFDKANTGSSGGLAGWTVVDDNFTVSNNVQLIANTTVSGFTITLPASPVVGNTVVITDGSLTSVGWSNNGVTVARNGSTILGYADNLFLNVSRSTATLVYDGTTWQVSSTVGPKGDTGPAGPIGNTGPQGAGVNATQRNYRFNATNNQTIFVGGDAYGSSLSYNVSAVSVYLNGVFLRPTEDYVANNGTTIYLNSGTFANDALDIVAFESMSLTAAQNTITTYVYTASDGQTSFGGSDINGKVLDYNNNNLFVTLNGLNLRSGTDYLQSNSSYIALTSGANANDELSIVAFGSFNVQGQNTQNTISTYYYTSTAGQTTFTGSDLYGKTLSYMQDGLFVVRNGATLRNKIDYTATNGTSVSLATPTAANDEIAITAVGWFSVAANGYTQVESNNLFLNKTTNDTVTGNVTFAANIIATGTGYFQVPQGTTAQRPSATSAGLIRFNTSLGTLETANGTAWANVGSSSSSGGGVSWQPIQNSNFIAVAGNGYFVNTAAANVVVTLPASPTFGQYITITDYARTFSSNSCTIYPNGNKIQANTANAVLATNGESASLVYVDSIQGWITYNGFVNSPVGNYSINYLVLAGGGGGGLQTSNDYGRGGGGAGGLLYGSVGVIPGTSYTVTVGAGGSAGSNGGSSAVVNLLSALGGGAGGAQSGLQTGANGGSGGGAAAEGPGTSGGSGTSGQGNPGGSGTSSGPTGAGGGGGAGGAGGNGTGSYGAAGGTGAAYSISGSTVTYAGGGGGGASYSGSTNPAGAGGSGGGGNGSGSGSGTPGTTNLGAGGGGARGYGGYTSGSGGSGIVIITYLGGQRAFGGTITSSGGLTIHTFNSSGTFTA